MWAFLSDAWVGLACFDFFAGWTFLVIRVSTRSRFDLVPFYVDSLVGTEDLGLSVQEALGHPSVLHVVPLDVCSSQWPQLLRGTKWVLFPSSSALPTAWLLTILIWLTMHRAQENPSFTSCPGSSEDRKRQ